MSEFVQVMTTTGSRDEALALARGLVERQLAACVHVAGPISSTYRWQGNVETSDEWTCLIKTRRELYDQVEAAIAGAHSYDTPEIVAVPIWRGSEKYLAWLAAETLTPASQ
jgi:periplasmic divalent cation tolerance protein